MSFLKPINFPEANLTLQCHLMSDKKELIPHDMPYYRDPSGKFCVCVIEVTPDQLREIKATGKLFVALPVNTLMPFTINTDTPFSYNDKPTLNGHARKDETSPGDNEQPNKGDSNLSVS